MRGRDGCDERVGDSSDRDDGRDGHAALAGRSVAGGHGGIGGHVNVGVGQHDHVILGATEGLNSLPMAAAGFVDVAGDRGRAHERHRPDVRVPEDAIHRLPIALDDAVDAVGEPGLLPEVGQQQRRRRIFLARLEQEAVATGDGVRHHPQRHHGREVEGGDPRHDPERLGHGVDVDPGGYLFGVGALEQVGYAAGELQIFEAPGHLALGVGEDLAMLGGDGRGHLLAVGVEQLPHAKQDLGAPGKAGGPPGREGAQGSRHSLVHLVSAGEIDFGHHLAEGGVVHGPGPARGPRYQLPVDPVTDPLHGSSLALCSSICVSRGATRA